jgi:uncharacterized protein YgbK (DUF1537 family)
METVNTEYLNTLPREWAESLLPTIQERVQASGRKVVVLDDDPTGTQTVHGIPVLTEWSVEMLAAELQSENPAFYVLTNSRSLSLAKAQSLNREIGSNLRVTSNQTGIPFALVSRSDSTLRGHFPGEIDALADTLQIEYDAVLVIPFFLEGGRLTFNDVHFVAEGHQLTPAAETPYARDAVFGYRSSNLREWVEEKTGGRIPAGEVTSLSIQDIREGGPKRVADVLLDRTLGPACVVNSVTYRDQEVFVAGLLEAEAKGRRFLYRTAASFARVRAGIEPRSLLSNDELTTDSPYGGLFVIGSYVPKTTAQLNQLLPAPEIVGLEVNVRDLLQDGRQFGEISRVGKRMNEALRAGLDVAVYTSRELITGADEVSNLSIRQRVSKRLIEIVNTLEVQPRYFVAKGGITSSDIATGALNVRRALISGQVLPGVPVWQLGDESRYPGTSYIVFPGNVGGNDALAAIQKRLVQESR